MDRVRTNDYAYSVDSEVKHIEPSVRERNDSSSSVAANESGTRELKQTETTITTFEESRDGGLLYRNGELVKQPAPTQDPRDPLNLPFKRKMIGVFCLCFFGAFAAAAELILGAMLPVFVLEYAGFPATLIKDLSDAGGLPAKSDPLAYLAMLPNAPPIWQVYLLASVPVLMMGAANLVLIPAAIAVGRRPVLLGCGVIAVAGCLWSGFSQSLGSHIGGRTVQALGAGTVESLIPFIIQDMVFVHQRNTWISMLFACQGVIIIALGIGSPYIIYYLSWRWVYYITAAVAAFFLVGCYVYMPETRWQRTRSEMQGTPRVETNEILPPRTWKHDLKIFHGKCETHKGVMALVDTLRTFFYPQIFFITMLNSAMIACAFGAGYTVAPALLTKPWSWSFLSLGLCLLPILVASVLVGGLTGYFADWTANFVARKRGKRVPENQLINLALPTACALIGSIIFGVAGNDIESYHWMVFLTGLAMMAFGFLGANTIGAVYVLECYPHLAGPALVNIASFRCLIAFVLSFQVSEWVANLGYLKSMMIYTGLMGGFAVLTPIVYYYGPAWRKRWPADHFGDGRE